MTVSVWAQGTCTTDSGAGEPCLPPSWGQRVPWPYSDGDGGVRGDEQGMFARD